MGEEVTGVNSANPSFGPFVCPDSSPKAAQASSTIAKEEWEKGAVCQGPAEFNSTV